MSAVNRAAVEAVLRQYTDPYLNQDPVSAGCVRNIEVQGDQVSVQLQLGYAAGLFKSGWAQMLQMAIEGLDGVGSAKVDIQCVIAPHKAQAQIPGLANVKNVVAVASGKGGVGKSTTAANLALALAREGARVGILDADIYGPSQGVMFGIAEGTRPKVKDQKWFVPIESLGVEVMSMAFLTDDNTPMVWRGPMVSGALLQLVTQTAWGDLDYLVIDMPPGTGDIQLTLAQKVPVVLYEDVYAMASVVGGIVICVLYPLTGIVYASWGGFGAVLLLRICAILFGWRLYHPARTHGSGSGSRE